MSCVFYETLEKCASVRLIRALHDVMDDAQPSKKTLSLLRKRGIIDAADDLDTIKGKVSTRMRSMEKTVSAAPKRTDFDPATFRIIPVAKDSAEGGWMIVLLK